MPHTRPLGVTAHATREDLLTGHQPAAEPDPGAGQRAGPARVAPGRGGPRRARLRRAGAALPGPGRVSAGRAGPARLGDHLTGLDLPDAELREAADRTNEAIEQQVEESAEVAELVRALEQQYDTAAESQQAAVDAAAGLLADGEAMPTADELAAQFERFLAENQDRTDPPDH